MSTENQTNSNTINNSEGGVVGGVSMGGGTVSHFTTNVERKTETNLAEAAKEIQQLLEELEQTYPTNTVSEKMAVAHEAIQRIEKNKTLKNRIVAALKGGTIEGFKQLLNHPCVDITVAAMEGWIS